VVIIKPSHRHGLLKLKLIDSLAEIDPQQWNALVGSYPFLGHEFLVAVQESGCVSVETGWEPLYLTLWHGKTLVGAMPMYLKSHSQGEFVFDHAWSDAFERHGLSYYPKLVCAAPFTPVTGPRLLANSHDERRVLAEGAIALARQLGVSSLHILFPNETDLAVMRELGFMLREGIQFHWQNSGYESFDSFLTALNHDKRKKIRQERRRAYEAGLSFLWLKGGEIEDSQLEFFYHCYVNTYHEHWSSPYLNLKFFRQIVKSMPENLLWIFAVRGDDPVACAMNVLGDDALYGRYWGTTEFVSGLHFETCYSQAVEYCIQHGISRFEGGAQGVHKMARGLLPTPTWSAHWIADSRFSDAIQRFLKDEQLSVDHYIEELNTHTPFKKI
jgi:predicted N-acyltransferase